MSYNGKDSKKQITDEIMDKIHRISILVLQNWMEKHMVGMRQLPIAFEFV